MYLTEKWVEPVLRSMESLELNNCIKEFEGRTGIKIPEGVIVCVVSDECIPPGYDGERLAFMQDMDKMTREEYDKFGEQLERKTSLTQGSRGAVRNMCSGNYREM